MSVSPATEQSSTTDAAITERIDLTRDMQAELRQIWNVKFPFRATISLFPPDDVYDAIPAEAVVGKKQLGEFCTKPVVVVAGAYGITHEVVTAYCPSSNSTTHRCPESQS